MLVFEMTLQMVFELEAKVTDLTDKLGLLMLRGHVSLESRLCEVSFVTRVAGIGQQ